MTDVDPGGHGASRERDVDVVVLGAGAAGLAAALEAATAGASVIVADAADQVGGSSRVSSGMLMAAGTERQRALGIDDDPETLLREYLQINNWGVDSGLVRTFAYGSAPMIEWLESLGVEFFDTLFYGGEESRPRTHQATGLGAGVIETLRQHAVRAGVEFALGQRVDRLLTDGDRVIGVAVGDDVLRAGAVVVATGGFGNNPERLAELYPTPIRAGEYRSFMGTPEARGDALDFATAIGAQIIGHGRGLSFVTPNFVPDYEATLPGWMLMVDQEGHRICDETTAYGVLERLITDRGGRAWVIFDEACRRGAPAGKPARYRQSNPSMPGRQSPNWNDEMIAAQAAAGRIATSDTIAGLASKLGLPADVLDGTVARYNSLVAAGEDSDFLKQPEMLEPIAEAPFYGAEVRPATVALTSVGLRIDSDARVLHRLSHPIPGLYAAGECTGGVLGDIYIGSGNSWTSCLVFGRIAGRNAARLATTAQDRPAEAVR